MKIVIGTNLFGDNERQSLCKQSLTKLSRTYKGEIELFNLQFEDGTNLTEDPGFKTLKVLKKKSVDLVPDARNKELPIMREMFDVLAGLDADYFIFSNNDIIISNRLIDEIKKTQKNCYPVSRLAIKPIDSLEDDIEYSHYQVAGFDTFAVKPSWWSRHKDKFPSYILGFPSWDVHYATIMMQYDKSTSLVNKWPPSAFHIMHDSPWKDDKAIPERVWNEKIFFEEHKHGACATWHSYIFDVLLKRVNGYRTPHANELDLEQKYFRDNLSHKRLDKDEGLVCEGSPDDPFFVICNGPSLKGFDFNKIKKYTSIGMNAAYRMFENINFWPTYFSCGDLRVGVSHKDEYMRLLGEKDSIFFLRDNATQQIKESGNVSSTDLKKLFEINCMPNKLGDFNMTSRTLDICEPGCTGQLSAMIGIALGFKNIILLGADCNYVENIKGALDRGPGKGLIIEDDIADNPNYWFDGYQQKGDEYNPPRGMTIHMNGWSKLNDVARAKKVKVTNCSMDSKIPFFEKVKFEDLKS